MNRSTLSLLAAATALAALTGLAAVTSPGADTPVAAAGTAPAQLPVERSSLLCPAPSTSEVAETTYTSFTPATTGDAGKSGSGAPAGEDALPDKAELKPSAVTQDAPAKDDKKPADDKADGKTDEEAEDDKAAAPAKKPAADKPVINATTPGTPVAAEANGAEAPALIGVASGKLAPGWTTQQTTVVPAGGARGLLGVTCTAPDTDFWFPGTSTAENRRDYVHLTNPDDAAAVVDIELYGPEGALKSQLTDGIPVPARSSVPVLLSTLSADPATSDVTVHVTTRSGRVGAVVRSAVDQLGSDWLPASADPAPSLVLPGIPADATSVQLMAFAPGEDDAELKIQLAGSTGTITPAVQQTIRVKSGMTASADLKGLTNGEAGALLLSPAHASRATPVVAALRVVRGSGDKQEVAFIPATGPVGERATVADNRAKGTTLSLTAPGKTAEVRVTASPGTEGGTPATKTYTVKAGTTVAVTPPAPAGLKGSYALTVETLSGGPVHAARMLALPQDGIAMFTLQTLTDDRATVGVPEAEQDLAVLED
ncbi:DUF5719 family protein [Streptomyces thermolilacinus]|uniref:Secreted protein n=1 Tax=Streptomyces thermolilacinus SPC6 TaxID=1306406 RepID=A0A1D3DUK3_9ACTN|nr:DUF5719 family protein [Streptomyces thermolilacinus]OEJ95998.1 hypothetical protein J116_017495 [Streptomyces thermolilacinus SPC6]